MRIIHRMIGNMLAVQSNDNGTYLREMSVSGFNGGKRLILTIHNAHPTQPKKVRFSFKNIEERIAEITTDRAPSGVCRCVNVDFGGENVMATYDD